VSSSEEREVHLLAADIALLVLSCPLAPRNPWRDSRPKITRSAGEKNDLQTGTQGKIAVGERGVRRLSPENRDTFALGIGRARHPYFFPSTCASDRAYSKVVSSRAHRLWLATAAGARSSCTRQPLDQRPATPFPPNRCELYKQRFNFDIHFGALRIIFSFGLFQGIILPSTGPFPVES
jgi:hypothetical protein